MDNFILGNILNTYKWLAISASLVFIVKFIVFFFTFKSRENLLFSKEQKEENEYKYNNYIQSISVFFIFFGLYGYLNLYHFNENIAISKIIIISAIVGVLGFIISEIFIKAVKRYYRIISFDKKYLETRTAIALQDFRPYEKGKIKVLFDTDTVEYNSAENYTDFEILKNETVRIIKCENNNIYIEKFI